jgi:hypothetical protein
MWKPTLACGLPSKGLLPAVVVLACLVSASIAPANAQDSEQILRDRFDELLTTEHQLRETFAAAQRSLGAARAEHLAARSFVNRNCLGLPESDDPRGRADLRLTELEAQNSALQRREQYLSTRRQDLERQRIALERDSGPSARKDYRRQMWQWINDYRDTYVRPFQDEVVAGIKIYTEGVHGHAIALRANGETCRALRASVAREQPATEDVEWAVLTTVVGSIQALQNLLRGNNA